MRGRKALVDLCYPYRYSLQSTRPRSSDDRRALDCSNWISSTSLNVARAATSASFQERPKSSRSTSSKSGSITAAASTLVLPLDFQPNDTREFSRRQQRIAHQRRPCTKRPTYSSSLITTVCVCCCCLWCVGLGQPGSLNSVFAHAWIVVPSSVNSRNSSSNNSSKQKQSLAGTTGTGNRAFGTTSFTGQYQTKQSQTSRSFLSPSVTTNTRGSAFTFRSMSTTTSTDEEKTAIFSATALMERLRKQAVNSWTAQLSTETSDNVAKSLATSASPFAIDNPNVNRTQRPVYNGHYIPVQPMGLQQPRLVLYNAELGSQLFGISAAQVPPSISTSMTSDASTTPQEATFWQAVTDFVAGNIVIVSDDSSSTLSTTSWATPYALSIMGTRYTSNCPYGTGDGYGDGRAITIGEYAVFDEDNDNNEHDAARAKTWELQLKGAGPTPFCRGADGRAVLRSSIREFLASESLHYLGIGTTRALSLVVSDGPPLIRRPWYKDSIQENDDSNSPLQAVMRQRRNSPQTANIPKMDDPRLAHYTDEQKRAVILQVRRQYKADPDVMQLERAAITCRASDSSFLRIGHYDLFARRATKPTAKTPLAGSTMYDTSTLAWRELEALVWHGCYREFRQAAYTPNIDQKDIAQAATILLQESAQQIATMVAHWIRVGFCQGNFNADNCLVGGKTMDYGPFGFMEEYDPLFAKWTGSGQHFGFMNQPNAGYANYGVLVESIVPIISAARGLNAEQHKALQDDFLNAAAELFQGKLDEVMRVKLGFDAEADAADEVWEQLEPLLRSSRVDWTLFFRELSYLMRDMPHILTISSDKEALAALSEEVLTRLIGNDGTRDGSSPFYEALEADQRAKWLDWIQVWTQALAATLSATDDASLTKPVAVQEIARRMLDTNPKFVLREWMLVEAYQRAANGDEAELHVLYSLIQRPYEEGSTVETNRYYRRAPDEALLAGGTAFMS